MAEVVIFSPFLAYAVFAKRRSAPKSAMASIEDGDERPA
jgi:hypothetical protein